MLSRELLNVLACPKCKGKLSYDKNNLVCKKCRLKFDIDDGIPNMLLEDAKKF